ncbi:hypothetical protein, partial [Pseudonocardia pini]|uniref:hypothetical protein n=1 Tax=Pseudonocardia pini TaxID=2758030 RepID=UPI001C68FDD6
MPRRRTDRVEDVVAVLVCAVGVVVIVVAGLVGVAVHGSVTARAAAEAAERVSVTATVTELVGPLTSTQVAAPVGRRAVVAWTSSDGAAHNAEVTVPAAVAVGAVLP